MKRLFVTLLAVAFAVTAMAQPYTFTDGKIVPQTSVKNQASSGTCWSFAGIGFLESELLVNGKGEYDFSEMWIVRHTYFEKALKYVRMHGTIEFAGGGADHDVFDVIKKYGIVPEEVYGGLEYGTDKHQHGELDAVLRAYVDAVIKNRNRIITTAWQAGVNGILDAYLGKVPEKFTYKGVEYTPLTFAASLGLNMDDYISFTSYTHHPFYTQYAIEVQDNWAWGLSWNVPLDDMMQIIDASLSAGRSVDWGSDVSETGFAYAKGFAVIPDVSEENTTGAEIDKWVQMNSAQRQSALINGAKEPIKEATITQEMRQAAFDNWQTTDDHGMVIVGTATDQVGTKFYKIKNSWDTNQVYGGYFYASVPFVQYKTMNITVNKSVIPSALKKKLGIQ